MQHFKLNSINKMIEIDRDLVNQVDKILDKYKEFEKIRLVTRKHNGRTEFYQALSKPDAEGKRRVYLNQNMHHIIEGAINRKFFFSLRKRLLGNIKQLDSVIDNLQDCSFESIYRSLPASYRFITPEIKSFYSKEEIEEWKSKLERQKELNPPPYPEALKHTARDGRKFRSKGEVIIYHILLDLGLPFVYEAPYYLKNGEIYHPDFTVLNPWTGKILLIEHDGSFMKTTKRTGTLAKIQNYYDDGLRFYDDILFTFDNSNESIDAELIKKMILACL